MKQLIFLSVIFISCSPVKVTTLNRGLSSLPDLTLTEASLAIRQMQSNAVYVDIDSNGNVHFKGKVTIDSLLVKNGWLYIGNPDSLRPHNGNDTLIEDSGKLKKQTIRR